MGFGYFIAGFLLLANPIIHVVDILPDFLGFLLICKGLSKLSYLHSGFSSARELFFRLALVELVRIACIGFIPYTAGSALTLFAFVFGVVELLFFIPALNDFYEGLNYVGMRYEGVSVFAKRSGSNKKTRSKDRGTSLKRFTLVFYVLRVVCTFVAEIPELQMYEYIGTVNTLSVDYRRFKPLFYVALGLLIVIMGLIFSVKVIGYFRGINKDTDFIRRLKEKFSNDILVKTWIFTGKRMKTVLALYALSAIFSLGLYIEDINVLPGILSAAFLAACALLVARDTKSAYAVLPLCATRGALSIVGTILQKIYYIDDKFSAIAVQYVERAAEQYKRMSILLIIESALAVLSFVVFAIVLMKVIKKHLAETGTDNQSLQYSKANRDAEIARFVKVNLIVNQIFMLLHFAGAGLYLLCMVNFPLMVVIQPVLTAIWVLRVFNTNSHINDLLYTPLANDAV